jgi:hypothetical protein
LLEVWADLAPPTASPSLPSHLSDVRRHDELACCLIERHGREQPLRQEFLRTDFRHIGLLRQHLQIDEGR